MKLILTLLSVVFTLGLFAQATISVKVSGAIVNTVSKEIKLSQQVDNTKFQDFKTVKLDKDGKFEIQATLPQADYYVLRVDEGMIYLILRDKSDIKVYSDIKNVGKFSNFVNSDESKALNEFHYASLDWLADRQSKMQQMQTNPANAKELNDEVERSLQEFRTKFQSFYTENQNSPALIATLNVLDPNGDYETFEVIVNSLNKSFGQSKRVQEINKTYLQVKAAKDAANMFAPGKPAPDFEELMLDRKTTMKLSDLKGKVVLLDFWASWCGPCRKENPNVVATYNKYKDKGFTVMSVSLDDNLERWKQAIEQDGLIWPNHVSDLKKWNSAAGKVYQVRSIPFTVLIDQQGNIVQTNLRGPALEEMVSRLLD